MDKTKNAGVDGNKKQPTRQDQDNLNKQNNRVDKDQPQNGQGQPEQSEDRQSPDMSQKKDQPETQNRNDQGNQFPEGNKQDQPQGNRQDQSQANKQDQPQGNREDQNNRAENNYDKLEKDRRKEYADANTTDRNAGSE